MSRCGVAIVLAVNAVAGAETMSVPQSVTETPHAVRGGVLMVPLTAERHGTGWPSKITLRTADGNKLPGVVAWVHAKPPPTRVRWTDDPRHLAVRAVTAADDSHAPETGAPYLLTRLPADGAGGLRLGSQTLVPQWLDPAPRRRPGRGPLPRVSATNRPDPESPFEYWRWVLLADALDLVAPDASDYGPVSGLVAEHYADLWRVGLARLAAANGRVRQRCLRLLTATAQDGTQAMAAWVADPAEAGRLLEQLLDPVVRDRELVLGASRWVDERTLLAFRDTPDTPLEVAVAVANRGEYAVEVKLGWLGTERSDVFTLQPGVLRRLELARPDGPTPTRSRAAGPDVQVLLLESMGRLRRLTFAADAVPVRPPGVSFALRPPLTLGDVQSGRRGVIDPARATSVQLRRIAGRWELFVDCRRPPAAVGMPPAGRGRPVEEVTLLFGAEPTVATLIVPEEGRHRLQRGTDDGTLEVHKRSYDDRWYCRVVLPEAWLRSPPFGALVGVVRRHGDDDAVETGPFASLPWHPDPGRARIDLAAWDELPK